MGGMRGPNSNIRNWNNLADVDLPIETFDSCRRCHKVGVLGDRLCLVCWDHSSYRKPGTILAKPNRSQILNEMFHKVK
jgi:hypothetical protein